jgi:hypothetical protein
MKFFARALLGVFKVGVLLIALSIPLCPIYDQFRPWPPAMTALAEFVGQKRVCVGYGKSSEIRILNGARIETSQVQRTFILFPAVFASPKIITITEDQSGKISKEESWFGLWLLILCYLVCLWGVWRFWVFPYFKKK